MFALSRNPVSGLSIGADFPINPAKKLMETGFLKISEKVLKRLDKALEMVYILEIDGC